MDLYKDITKLEIVKRKQLQMGDQNDLPVHIQR